MTLTKNETVFLSRVADVMVANPALSIEDGMRAVLARDEELWLKIFTKPDLRNEVVSEMATDVYSRLRAA